MMNKIKIFFKKRKKYYFQKILLVSFIILFSIFSYPPKASATLWPGVDPAIKQGLEVVYDTIQGIILGALKQASIMMLNKQIDSLAGSGAGGGPSFITNWNDYLVQQPLNRTELYINDYISQMTRGRNTQSGYRGEGFSENYIGNLGRAAQENLKNNDNAPTYEGDPDQMFASGNFKNMSLYLSGTNNPWAFHTNVENEKEKYLQKEQSTAQTRSIAYQGFTGTPGGSDPNSVSSPGILTKDVMAHTLNLPGEALVSAKSIQEVIVAVVGIVVSKAVRQGFSSVRRKLQKTADVQNRINASINKAISEPLGGPGARF